MLQLLLDTWLVEDNWGPDPGTDRSMPDGVSSSSMFFNFSRNRSAAGMMGWNRKISNVATRIPALLSQNALGRSHVVSKPEQQGQRLLIFLISRGSELQFLQLRSNCLSNNSSPCSIVLQSVKIVHENGITYTSSSSVHLELCLSSLH